MGDYKLSTPEEGMCTTCIEDTNVWSSVSLNKPPTQTADLHRSGYHCTDKVFTQTVPLKTPILDSYDRTFLKTEKRWTRIQEDNAEYNSFTSEMHAANSPISFNDASSRVGISVYMADVDDSGVETVSTASSISMQDASLRCSCSLPPGTTTLMIRNVPRRTTQTELVEQLEYDGFADVFDFLYAPSDFATGENKGFAFVNFVSEASAKALANAWHKRRVFDGGFDQQTLNVGAAAIQGRVPNLQKWNTPKMRRVRNPDYRPYMRDICNVDSSATSPSPPKRRHNMRQPGSTRSARPIRLVAHLP